MTRQDSVRLPEADFFWIIPWIRLRNSVRWNNTAICEEVFDLKNVSRDFHYRGVNLLANVVLKLWWVRVKKKGRMDKKKN